MSATASVLGILIKTGSMETPLGIIFKNENLNEDMLSILHHFHNYLPKVGEDQFDGQLFAGDQLTVERATNVIASVSNGYSSEDRLEDMTLQIGDWHAAVKILDILKGILNGATNEPCSEKQSEPDLTSIAEDLSTNKSAETVHELEEQQGPDEEMPEAEVEEEQVATMAVESAEDNSEEIIVVNAYGSPIAPDPNEETEAGTEASSHLAFIAPLSSDEKDHLLVRPVK
ncbi:hypothetical protein QZH41_010465 [Actinostola sp. cb2023]|nr:hypothetical protein QZH41_010465 [Actinostola sp. cb2023]